jgi:hypothetical protein
MKKGMKLKNKLDKILFQAAEYVYIYIVLIKNGYILATNVIENKDDILKISLIKIDDTLPDFSLPFTCCQLIFDKII